jgi:uncharacterized protein YcfJ
MTFGTRFAKFVVGLTAAAVVAGCESKAGTGAIVGALGGAAVGGVIGNNSKGRTGEGAAIGAAAGAIGGALIGHSMDKADEKKARERERYDSYENRGHSTYAYDRGGTSASNYVTKRDVIDWNHRGVKDEIIIDRIERSGQVFRLTGADENELRDAGVSEPVIRAMKDTARR